LLSDCETLEIEAGLEIPVIAKTQNDPAGVTYPES